ncbi:S9 family peptidase [Nesterenkonia sp. MY13]|uniref:S9 family peptidase n=1 Tax=Nesterenkonia sedimenti TaxID=1463632 RepID=A0A7X8YDS7_9MICC|nr:S9 family peptidase [Nesterenkonia sedimenti]NLS09775.1 S9 family peptidase [Nesterenkonia sedimenti]
MTTPTPPQAKKVPTQRTHHGDTVTDPYEWLRDKESPEVIEHLHAENAYTESVTSDQESLRQAIFDEIKHRTVETDLSVPAHRGDFWYFTRTIEGEQHPIYCRVPVQDPESWAPPELEPGVELAGEQVYFDTNAEAAKHPFYSLGGMSISEDGALLAYSEDTSGDEHYTLRLRNLQTGENLPEQVDNVHGGGILEPTGQRVYYMVADSAWRPYRLYQHTVGTSADQDRLLLEIEHEELWTGIGLSADKKELLIVSGNSEYNATRILDATDPEAEPRLLISEERRLLHNAEPMELDGQRMILLVHNAEGPNNSVSLTTTEDLAAQDPAAEFDPGTPLLRHEDSVKIDDQLMVTAAQVLISARVNTVESVYLLPLETIREVRAGGAPVSPSSLSSPQFEEELCTVALVSAEYEAPLFRVLYTSWLTPPRIYDIDHHNVDDPQLRRETPVNDVDLDAYRAEREWATASDGTQIPVTVIRHRDVTADGKNPLLVYGYGSYEISMDPAFGIPRLSLLDRGVVFAVAHIRGGGELGRRWYEDGKKLAKKNTFTDFLAVTDHLNSAGWGDPTRVAALGGSAGGLLMGAVANLAPEKYRAIVAQVPFVDNLTSILDPDLPLSALEWEEWGNPLTDAEVYKYMKSYSPYENIHDVDYPAIAAVTSLHDTRVLYVEPAKWVQRLREHQQGDAPIVFKCEMDGGHGGASGRYEQWKERAWDYAFLAHHLEASDRQF